VIWFRLTYLVLLSTDEILRYFADYAPSYVLWLDDSSGNIVFGDAANCRRALFSLGQPIRMPAPRLEGEMADGEAPAVAAEAQVDTVWRRGPNYEKSGVEYAVLMRQAVSTDAKKGKPNKSKRLWLQGGDKGRRSSGGYGGGGGGGGGGSYREDRASRVRPGHVPRARQVC